MGELRSIRSGDAITAQAFALAWPGSTLRLVVDGERRVVRHTKAHEVVRRLELAQSPDMRFEVTGARFGAFWVMVTGTDQNQRLSRFRPLPTIVLREGASSRRTAIWWLSQGMTYDWCLKGNLRIAHFLRAVKKTGNPDHALFPVPGTAIRAEGARPVPVMVERLSIDAHTPKQVVGRLKDPPAPKDWRDR